ncbi:NAD(P)-dependent dehydrogenase (short-subunit alcohol dehydrogenase family) [Paucibacter oligotrophus]|uniref:NAD(P)-dependent dehydrogenase (Short-subunit alcohol dehydrogenase family) n=1 Tax=Roseateles oligotrophus TaxID=1769250 RepID=A0A840LAT0_9BURK|nr:SDR family NAD(P)-dependent oxidoreductase [Roseateles oligotrophus]MBB4843905.1 NAD(P)-dependent dehydrogenase (short-subunit alcohol dehydrogenase family) [Roseateles oligotrophus]
MSPAKQLFIITGASRGMGEAIARQLLNPEHLVIGISRRRSAGLDAAAQALGAELQQWELDLAEPLAAAQALQQWLEAQPQPQHRFSQACLINNAGVVTAPGPVEEASLAELSNALRVGLEACLLLSSAFLRGTAGLGRARRVLNISSGLGRRAMAGAAPYCAAKAGMDNLSRAMALDEAAKPDGAAIVSLAPGIIDTEMQVQLRGGDPAKFPDQAVFANFKNAGLLSSPEDAAAKVLKFLARPDFGSTVLADVREA